MFNDNMSLLQRAFWIGGQTLVTVTGETGTYNTDYVHSHLLNDACLWVLSNSTMQTRGLYFGSDPTPATKRDYKLGAVISSGLSNTSNQTCVIGKESDGKYVAVISGSLKNTGTIPINIYEMGLVTYVKSGSSSSAAAKYFMVDRVVLTEPISLQPDEEKIITYKITFNQTQA